MRFTYLSNSPWTSTGYGIQAGLFTTRLTEAGHPTAVISNYGHQGPPINWNGVQVFGNSYHPWAQDVMHMHSQTFKADAMLTCVDIQIIEPQGLQGTKWIPWFPVDHLTIPSVIMQQLQYSEYRITMSKHASAEMDKAGMEHYYIPCGVDTKVYKPLDRIAAREAVQLSLDKFIVGMVAMNKGNPSRKAFQQNIMAFAALQKKYKDCVLYLHTMDGLRVPDGVNLIEFCKAIGLRIGYAFTESAKDADVIFADQYGMALGYDTPMMAQLYNSMDVHLLVTMGEGFGIPLIEAQACGTPVITGDWTSMPELCFSGWKVAQEDADPIFTNLFAFQMLPRAAAIADKLEMAYQMRGNEDYRKRAVDGAKAYDADKVFEKNWLPFVKDVEYKLHEEKPYPVLSRNLELLRVA